ncbi:Phosphoglycerol transferase MdoB [Evansella caseinilytica]|uniref:Phosphoglycerol transferase MdoB n=1 Tax=Evansella caseinilytica TaxID=1503961 RepID=A0A1H3QV30_9BACI|nr:LTA synthase family protein [Evansella caseinilytica]SDZ16885.1 Phosphoglycerol transferase MdoB [Evansella caseinilytica]
MRFIRFIKNLIKVNPIIFVLFFFLWMKTIIVSLVDYSITIDNWRQLIIMVLNPLPTFILAAGLIMTRKKPRQLTYAVVFAVFATIILYANGVYHREFTDYITIPLLLVGGNAADLSSSIIELVQWRDILYLTDFAVFFGVLYFIKKKRGELTFSQLSFRQLTPYLATVLVIGIVNLSFANIERPQLLTRSFDRELIVKNIGIYNFHLYDTYLHATSRAQRVFASEEELLEINEYIEEEKETVNRDLFGVAKGKNVILISAESLQNFVIGSTVNGEEITPFLNELIGDSIYFEEFYHQTAQGKTSDSEFIVDNSLYPLARGAVFFTHPSNEYYALPEIMNENGYYTASLHANNGSFWNRNIMYDQFGYDRFYTVEDYEVTEEDSVGWGMKDIPFMEQSVEHLLDMPQPFYTKLITLTNHFPFELDEEDSYIDQFDSNSRTLNRYFPTVRYMDEAIRVFFDELKENGLYEDSMIVIYGDHYGISSNHNKAMSYYLDKEITPFVEAQLQQVPLIIHIPGVEGETLSTVSGQIDLRPTLLHLLGIQVDNQVIFGKDLFSEDRKELVIFRDGTFITEDAIYTSGVCYSKETEEPVDEEEKEALCGPYLEEVQQQLSYSDRIIYGDLLRFDTSREEISDEIRKNENIEIQGNKRLGE